MKPEDLTRWNRAGLSRFRYIDGNAVTYLERLRARLAEAYTAPGESLPKWSDLLTRHPISEAETPAEREARLLAQYQDVRRDHGWEILRSFARSTHVLTEHIDAYANEGFIRTATQWESVRRLIELLDARPAPPASARTELAFDAKAAGGLAKGFRVKNVPDDGGKPAVFETVEPLEVSPALNLLRPTDWNRSQLDFTYAGGGAVASFPLADAQDRPMAGEIAVLEIAAEADTAGFAVRVQSGAPGSVTFRGQDTEDGKALSVKRWRVALHAGAGLVRMPRLAGAGVVTLSTGHNLAPGRDRVVWHAGGTWRAARVMAVDGERVQLDAAVAPAKGADLFLLAAARAQTLLGVQTLVLPVERGAAGKVWSETLGTVTVQQKLGYNAQGAFVEYEFVTGAASAFYVPGGSKPVAQVTGMAPAALVLAGAVQGVRQGDWIVSAGAALQAVRVVALSEHAGDTVIETMPVIADLNAPVHLKFTTTCRPLEHDQNRTAAFDDSARSDHVTRFWLSPSPWPDALARGRQVIIETGGLAHSARVSAVDRQAGFIEVTPAFPGTELNGRDALPHQALQRCSTSISANVVMADHGESQPLKILGSGDATRSNQVFEIKAQDLAFVSDPLMPAGVRAAIEILVGEQRWEQVGNLRDSGPTDAHFELRLGEDGKLAVQFGDGRNGRRLPSGADNLRYIWRKGVGAGGNLAAQALKKIIQPDPLIAAVRQPLPAVGGAGAQDAASLRENAAAGLLTLGRAVSASDFGKLAMQNAQVLQALSYPVGPGSARGQAVAVIIVPAGGRMGSLADDLLSFLRKNSLPGVTIDVRAYVALPLSLEITLEVKTAEYDPAKVARAVRTTLEEAYALERARLGAPLFRSQILHLIKTVEGVENAEAAILTSGWGTFAPAPLISGAGTTIRRVMPRKHQMIHYVPGVSTFSITTQEFSL